MTDVGTYAVNFRTTLPEPANAAQIRAQILCVMQDVIRTAWKETDLTDPQRAGYLQNMLQYQLTNTFLDMSHPARATASVSLDLKPLRPVYHIKATAFGVDAYARIF